MYRVFVDSHTETNWYLPIERYILFEYCENSHDTFFYSGLQHDPPGLHLLSRFSGGQKVSVLRSTPSGIDVSVSKDTFSFSRNLLLLFSGHPLWFSTSLVVSSLGERPVPSWLRGPEDSLLPDFPPRAPRLDSGLHPCRSRRLSLCRRRTRLRVSTKPCS